MTSIAVVPPRNQTKSKMLSALALAGFTVFLGASTHHIEYLISSLAVSGSILFLYERGASKARRFSKTRRILFLLPDLLREGIDAVPGRLLVHSVFTGRRPFHRLYSFRESFTPIGDASTITLDDLASREHTLLVLVKGEEGVIIGDAYMVQLEDAKIYVLVTPTTINVRTGRKRLRVRRGDEYAEATINCFQGAIAFIINHVGRRTKAILSATLRAYGLSFRARLAEAYSGSTHYTLLLSTRSKRIIILASPPEIPGVPRALGYRGHDLVALGPGLEGSISLELKRGLRVLERDETSIETSGLGGKTST